MGNSAAYVFTHRRPILEGLQDAGFEVELALPERADALDDFVGTGQEALRRVEAELGVRTHAVPLRRGQRPPHEELRLTAALVRLFRETKPDVALLATIKPVLFGGAAARIARVPAVVSTVTGMGHLFVDEGATLGLVRGVIRRPLAFALGHPRGRVIVQNPEDLAVLRTLAPPDRVTLIPGSGVDLARFPPSPEPEGTPVVVLPARLIWDKGVGEFVEAARMLRARGVVARFALVGDRDDENPAAVPAAVLERWQRDGHVELWGWRRDMPEVVRQATVVCLPSYREGTPKALLEAMAAGRAFVTTDVPGCRDVACDGTTGLTVPPRRADALADALERLLRDRELRARLATEGRRRAEDTFSTTRITARFCEVCAEAWSEAA